MEEVAGPPESWRRSSAYFAALVATQVFLGMSAIKQASWAGERKGLKAKAELQMTQSSPYVMVLT